MTTNNSTNNQSANLVFSGNNIQNSGQNCIQTNSSGQNNYPNQPSFLAYPSADISNVTGDGTTYTVIFNTILRNVSSSYNIGTGLFTAPLTGFYLFTSTLIIQGLTALDTNEQMWFQQSGSASRIYQVVDFNSSTLITSGLIYFNGSVLIPLTAADTVGVQILVSGSTKTVSVGGSDTRSFFSGILLA